jgi:hypothetical protein
MRLCLVDCCETHDPVTHASQICLFGRKENGESVCVVVLKPVYSIVMAASPGFDHRALQYGLAEHLKGFNGQHTDAEKQQRGPLPWKRARCTRTLCACKACKTCGPGKKCACRCFRCKEDPCTCQQFTVTEINHDICSRQRMQDRAPVLSVEPFMARSFIGYERDERRFLRIKLSRACYAAPAKTYLHGVDTGALPSPLTLTQQACPTTRRASLTTWAAPWTPSCGPSAPPALRGWTLTTLSQSRGAARAASTNLRRRGAA